MKQEDIRVSQDDSDEEIHIHYCTPSGGTNLKATVLFSHGFTVSGVESHRMFLEIAEVFTKNGMASVLFDYRGAGYSSGWFRDLKPSRELKDLLKVYNFTLKELSAPEPLGLLGQSHGSYLALMAIPKMQKLSTACLWGTSASPEARYRENLEKRPTHKGFMVLEKGFLLSPEFLDDMDNHDALEACEKIKQPIAFIHAGEDQTVPIEEGREAYEAVQSDEKEFKKIEGANHSYKRQPKLQEEAIEFTLNWFNSHLINKK